MTTFIWYRIGIDGNLSLTVVYHRINYTWMFSVHCGIVFDTCWNNYCHLGLFFFQFRFCVHNHMIGTYCFSFVSLRTLTLLVTVDLYKVQSSYLVCICLESGTFRWNWCQNPLWPWLLRFDPKRPIWEYDVRQTHCLLCFLSLQFAADVLSLEQGVFVCLLFFFLL